MIKIYVGKSASGKDTFLKKDIASGEYLPIVTYTTRPMREGEVDGVDYKFVTKDQFFALDLTGQIAEKRSYDTLVAGMPDTWYYGSPKIEDPDKRNYVTILDVNGAMEYIRIYGPEAIQIVFVYVPNDIRKRRAMKRGSFDETEWLRREADDDIKFSGEKIDELRETGVIVSILNNSREEAAYGV